MIESISSDYHIHSTFSDGILTPEQLLDIAQSLNIKELALTDHDTMDGLPAFYKAAANTQIKIIAGMEVSSAWRASNIHILAYWLNYQQLSKAQITKIQTFVDMQKELRMRRAKIIAETLNKIDLKIDFDEVCELAKPSVPTRPHFARYMIEKGYFSDFGEVFKKVLGKGRIGDVSITWQDMQSVVVQLVKLGAQVSLAHPYAYGLSLGALKNLFKDFKNAGGMALEVVNSTQDIAKTKALENYCKQLNLKMTWGSDFHTPERSQLGRLSPLPKNLKPLLV